MAAKAQAESHGRGRAGRRREILGIVLLALGLFSALSMTSTHAGNPQMMGPGGAATAAGLYALLGVGGYLMIGAMLVAAWRAFRGQPLVDGFVEGVGALMLLASVTVLLHLPFAGGHNFANGPGGLAGQWLGEVTASFIGSVGAALAASALLFMGLLLVTDIQMKEVVVVTAWAAQKARGAIWMGLQALGRLAVAMFPEREAHAPRALEAGDRAARYDDAVEDPRARRRRLAAVPAPMPDDETDGVRVGHGRHLEDARAALGHDAYDDVSQVQAPRVDARRAAMSAILAEVAAVEQFPRTAVDEQEDDDNDDDALEGEAATLAPSAAAEREEITQQAEALVIAEAPANDAAAGPGPIIVEPAWRTRMREREQARQDAENGTKDDATDPDVGHRPTFIKLKDGAYKLPATDLLEYLPPQGNETDKQGLYEMAERLEQSMANYGVRGKVKEIHMGPVVTMFEFAPEPGTRTGKIANLEKDLAMALEAQAVRILAPIPGKSVVGVEVPNKTREMVYLREILEDDCFTKANSKLQVALGKDIKGAPVSVNLAKMPHLLVAGTTGSGKSVAVNGMIVSLLYNASPEEVRFIMVDPKMLELSIYEGIPHLLLPVVTDPKKANLALRWAVEEMERRYELLARAGVRDIASYNAKIAPPPKAASAEAVPAAQSAAPLSGKKRLKVMITGPDGTEQEMQIDPDDAYVYANDKKVFARFVTDTSVLPKLDLAPG